MFKNIKQGPLKMPDRLSEEAKDLLVKLLNWDPTKRLGAGRTDAEEIKSHSFFRNINWKDVYERKLVHPRPPKKDIKLTKAALSLEERAYGAYANIGKFDVHKLDEFESVIQEDVQRNGTEPQRQDLDRNWIPGWSFIGGN
jgi:serine/threonine protein kinase